ncbi:MAG: sodium:proton antiporter NhaD [Bacteroidales bacterium]|nr:sodium:proton antiporter NhaD [Bacteroidales bacterium]
MFILMVVVFVLGYTMIALEHPLRIDKAAPALLIGVLTWVIYILGAETILDPANIAAAAKSNLDNFLHSHFYLEFANIYSMSHDGSPVPFHEQLIQFIAHHEILHHLSEISTILFFLLGAMTIVEIVDQHQGFKVITDKIKTTNKVKLLWILSFLTFFMSAALDNLTTTIVLVALLRKLIDDKKTRWFYASMVILAANAGGAWSPIGDVTTIMLWIGGQITAANIIVMVFIPSLVTMVIPLIILSFMMKGNVTRPDSSNQKDLVSKKQQVLILILGVSALLFVPVFKTVTHLPPYMGMLLGLGVLWTITEILHRWHNAKKNNISTDNNNLGTGTHANSIEGTKIEKLQVIKILSKVDVPTILFFLGILSAVASLQSAGHLGILAEFLDKNLGDIYLINIAIGLLSSIVDNVPLVAGAMGMYEIAPPDAVGYASHFVVDGTFWEFLAYCAGTGGSVLIIGSAAGVAAMGMEKIDFIWYLKKISLLALIGYLAGAGAYYLQMTITGHA